MASVGLWMMCLRTTNSFLQLRSSLKNKIREAQLCLYYENHFQRDSWKVEAAWWLQSRGKLGWVRRGCCTVSSGAAILAGEPESRLDSVCTNICLWNSTEAVLRHTCFSAYVVPSSSTRPSSPKHWLTHSSLVSNRSLSFRFPSYYFQSSTYLFWPIQFTFWLLIFLYILHFISSSKK